MMLISFSSFLCHNSSFLYHQDSSGLPFISMKFFISFLQKILNFWQFIKKISRFQRNPVFFWSTKKPSFIDGWIWWIWNPIPIYFLLLLFSIILNLYLQLKCEMQPKKPNSIFYPKIMEKKWMRKLMILQIKAFWGRPKLNGDKS